MTSKEKIKSLESRIRELEEESRLFSDRIHELKIELDSYWKKMDRIRQVVG